MPKECKNCYCECHCESGLHAHHFDGDLCTCEVCEHKGPKTRLEQMEQLTHDPTVD